MTELLQQWISASAQHRPEAIAVAMDGRVLSYAQLEEATNRLARLLKAAGCGRGDRVCFAIPKSPEAIIAIVGILKADCIHVPIDTASPAARVGKIVRASEPLYVLGVGSTVTLLEDVFSQCASQDSIRVGWLEDSLPAAQNFTAAFTWSDTRGYSGEPLSYQNSSSDAAHILFTSGSTGDPKGVVITHANVIHFVEWAIRYFGMTDSDRVSCHPPLHFDLATFDIFGTFASGAQLHLVPPELNLLPNKLVEFIRRAELTHWFSVPSVLNYMAKFDVVRSNDFPMLRRLLWCGEVFPIPALRYWMQRLPRVTFTNLYGPTETTIASSYYTLPACPIDTDTSIPIGTACDGEELLVLDSELRPVALGEVGDLYIRGVGLSPGYWRDPVKTAGAFVPYRGELIYRTGDLARIATDGLVYFVGRNDTQIKSRGYRIELGEVEAALNGVKELRECAVVAIPTDGFETYLICAAYSAQESSTITPSQLRLSLSTILPPYMLPARWMDFVQLPKNGNGKIDRRRLQELFALEAANKRATKQAEPNPSVSSLEPVAQSLAVTDLASLKLK